MNRETTEPSTTRSTPLLSVVIPAYNEEERLPATLAGVAAFLERTGWTTEIVVVDDGSHDHTGALAAAAGARALRNPVNRGKGASVRRGMLAARGRYRLMTDADLSTPVEEVERLLGAVAAGADVAIGSRAAAGARIEVRQPRPREIAGRAFNRLVRLLLLPDLGDTQCGFKLFTAHAAEVAFSSVTVAGFAFDVEVLCNARDAGLRIVELPVTWRNDVATKVSPFKGLKAFTDLGRLWLARRRFRGRRRLERLDRAVAEHS